MQGEKIGLFCFQELYSVVCVILKEGLVGPRLPILLWVEWPRKSFFGYDNTKDLKAHFLMAQHTCKHV